VVTGGLALALTASRAPRFGPVALVLLAGVLVTGKAAPPQVSLLLLPAIALAGLRWRDHLIWATAELTYFAGVWLYIAASSDANRGLPAGAYLVLLVARIGAICWLGVQGVRAILDPRADPGRVAAEDPTEDGGWEPEDAGWQPPAEPAVVEVATAGPAPAGLWLDLEAPDRARDHAP
jgi:hypothetical protein